MENKDWQNHWWPAPAKLNLMLNVTGQRDDGYHELQTVFQLIGICDWLNFQPTNDGQIRIQNGIVEFDMENNLIIKAAQLLKKESGTPNGARIVLKKVLPMGAGLGGGSSDAATTLLVLNKMWGLDYSIEQLATMGLQLGADVPIFVHGHSCWAEGVGERFSPLELPEAWYVVVMPEFKCSTADIFSHKDLTRDNSPITIRDFLDGHRQNVCLPVVIKLDENFNQMYLQFSQVADVQLTGTGSSLFAVASDRAAAVEILEKLPDSWAKWVVKGESSSPLHKAIEQFFKA